MAYSYHPSCQSYHCGLVEPTPGLTTDSQNVIIPNLQEQIYPIPEKSMNKLKKQFLLNVGFIFQESIGFTREFTFKFPIIHFLDDFVLHNINGKIKVSRTSEGLLSQGDFLASQLTTCSRCLVNFEQQLNTEFTELFAFNKLGDTETELIYPDDGEINFGPIIREYFMLDTQISPVCSESCKGLCPVCGIKITDQSCDHRSEPLDPRFSILKSLLDDD